ncbi:MAG: PKD domain-containing protein [Thermoplasmata archaeon]|nr:PKD domain-containing protein [Thermoplasmata archaeon]
MRRGLVTLLGFLLLIGLILGGSLGKGPGGVPRARPESVAAPLVAWTMFAPLGVPAGVEIPGTLNVTAAVAGGIPPYHYSWDFGAGSPEVSGPSARFAPTGPGEYFSVLNVSDAAGQLATSLTPVDAIVRNATAWISASAGPRLGTVPLRVSFWWGGGVDHTGRALIGPAWSFGDGATTVGPYVNHTYTAPGSYAAEVTATTPTGQAVTYSITIEAVSPGSPPLVTSAEWLSYDSCDPLNPSAFESWAFGGVAPYTYLWNFGDGSLGSTSANATHHVTGNQSIPPGVVVTDARGDTGSSLPINQPVPATAIARACPPVALVFFGIPWYTWIVGIEVIVAAVVLVWYIPDRRRRMARRP